MSKKSRKKRRTGVPPPSSRDAEIRMKAAKQRDTRPETTLRSKLHRLGLRYRLHRAVVPGVQRKPDIVFGPSKVVVFVHGCFWHGCPKHATWPKANADFWRHKILTNKKRDADTSRRLTRAGWKVIRIWEHEDMGNAAGNVARVVEQRRALVEV